MPDDALPQYALPPYSYVPGLFPHPHSHPAGHRFDPLLPPPNLANLPNDPTFRLGVLLFDAGYYWEAHEAWERIWHAAGRSGEIADLCKALIQLAVAGVKVREGREDGVRAHARRAAEMLGRLSATDGIDTPRLAQCALAVAEHPPTAAEPRRPVEIVFDWRIGHEHV